MVTEVDSSFNERLIMDDRLDENDDIDVKYSTDNTDGSHWLR